MKRSLLISMLLLSGCSSSLPLIGTWKSGQYSPFEKLNAMIMNSDLGYGNTLELNTDSSWTLTGTCEIIEGNKWEEKSGSLILYPNSSRGINNNAINRSESDLDGLFIRYEIKRRSLVTSAVGQITERNEQGEVISRNFKIIEKLKPIK